MLPVERGFTAQHTSAAARVVILKLFKSTLCFYWSTIPPCEAISPEEFALWGQTSRSVFFHSGCFLGKSRSVAPAWGGWCCFSPGAFSITCLIVVWFVNRSIHREKNSLINCKYVNLRNKKILYFMLKSLTVQLELDLFPDYQQK